MSKIDKYYWELLLDCLLIIRFSQKDSNKKLKDFEEMVSANNRLLMSLLRILIQKEGYLENSETQLNEELLEALIKYSVEKEKWGES